MLRLAKSSLPMAIVHKCKGEENMRLSRVVSALVLALPVVAMSAALTNSNIDTRTTTNVLSFSDLAFDNLDKARSDFLQFHGAVGDSGTFTITGPFDSDVAVQVVPGSGMSISNETAPGASGVSYTAAVTGTTGLTVTQSWNVRTSSSMLTGVTSDGLNYLEFIGDNNGFLKSGGVFDYSVTMPGNWSTMGTSTGDSQWVGLNSEFTITKNFVYDPLSNTTTVEVLNSNYDLSQNNVGLDIILYGSPVSEPAPSALLLAGVGALGWMVRRRKAAGR